MFTSDWGLRKPSWRLERLDGHRHCFAAAEAEGGDDLIVSGMSTYENNQMALRSIFAEWNSSNTYAQRVANIINGTGTATRLNGSYFLNDSTVFDDASVDSIMGGEGQDWLLVNTDSVAKDVVSDAASNEFKSGNRFQGRRMIACDCVKESALIGGDAR